MYIENYKKFKKQLDKNAQKLAEANNQTEKLDNSSKDINSILDKLKPSKLNKNNNLISNEDVEKIKNFIFSILYVYFNNFFQYYY